MRDVSGRMWEVRIWMWDMAGGMSSRGDFGAIFLHRLASIVLAPCYLASGKAPRRFPQRTALVCRDCWILPG